MPGRAPLAAALIAIGTLVVAVSGGYLVYTRWSLGQASRFEYEVPRDDRISWFVPTSPSEDVFTSVPIGLGSPDGAADGEAAISTTPEAADTPGPEIPKLTLEVSSLFPAQFINPKYWAAPLWAGSDPFGGPGLPGGFERAVSPGQGLLPGESRPASRITIPAIDVDAEVRDLQSVTSDDAVSFEAVDKFVGHIPDTANPGGRHRLVFWPPGKSWARRRQRLSPVSRVA